MKQRRRRPATSEGSDLDERQTELLLTGSDFESLLDDPLDTYVPPFESEEAEREAWERNRDFLLLQCEPGKRPHAYFKYECKGKRLLLSGDPLLAKKPIRGNLNDVVMFTDGTTANQQDITLVYESDYQLLTRLKLLNKGEAEQCEVEAEAKREAKMRLIQIDMEGEDETTL